MGVGMEDRRAPYMQVADALRADIREGRYPSGDRLPTVAELAATHGVAKMTIQRALDVLRDEGYVVSWQGRGTFVRSDNPEDAPAGGDTTEAYAAIIQRLESMHDEIQRLAERVGQLEAQQ